MIRWTTPAPRMVLSLTATALAGSTLLAGCAWNRGHLEYQPLGMWDRGRLKPMEGSPRPNEVSLAREPVPGTAARGSLAPDDVAVTGRSEGKLVTEIPIPVTPQLLERGQERFNIYCSSCHGKVGDGEGLIVQRGFPHPPDYAIPRLRKAAVGHLFDVMTNGYGVMYSQAQNVAPNDRWAIAAYIRVLQKRRPVVPVDLWATQRRRQREQGMPEPGARPIIQEGVLAPPEGEPGAPPPSGGGH